MARTAMSLVVGRLVGAASALVTYAVRDAAVVLVAHARRSGEPRRAAMLRGRAAAGATRAGRERRLVRALRMPATGSTVPDRLVAAAGLAVLGAMVAVLPPAGAAPRGDGGTASLIGRWHGLSPGGQIMVGAGILALVVVAGGSVLPATAGRGRPFHGTPCETVIDGAGMLLTFTPGPVVDIAAGRSIRAASDYYRWAHALPAWTGPDGLTLTGPDNLVAEHYLQQAAAAERAITPVLQGMVDRSPPARLEGLGYRLKPPDAYKRKLATRLLDGPRMPRLPDDAGPSLPADDAARSIGDGVRYTVTVPDPFYTSAVTSLAGRLRQAGYEPVAWRNTWAGPGCRGITSAWRDPGGPGAGQVFEIRFHTPTGFDAMTTAQGLVGTARLPGLAPAEVARIDAERAALLDRVPVPPGAAGIGGPSVNG